MLAHAGTHHPTPKYSQMSSVRKQGWGGDGPVGSTQILLNGRDGDEETSTSKRHGAGESMGAQLLEIPHGTRLFQGV